MPNISTPLGKVTAVGVISSLTKKKNKDKPKKDRSSISKGIKKMTGKYFWKSFIKKIFRN